MSSSAVIAAAMLAAISGPVSACDRSGSRLSSCHATHRTQTVGSFNLAVWGS
jgi:hypothetical protein